MKYSTLKTQVKLSRIFILILVIMSGLLRSSAQNCYQSFGENAGITNAVGSDSLNAAACRLKEAIPEQFRSQFGVYGASHYLHIARTKPGTPPAVQYLLNQIEAQTPYYLLFVKESTSDSLIKQIKVYVKLPDHDVWECITENEQIIIANQVQLAVTENYKGKNSCPQFYPYAEKAGIEKLKTFITKITDCCPGLGQRMENNTICTLCPDAGTAISRSAFFKDSICAVEIPIFVETSNSARPDTIQERTLTFVDDKNQNNILIRFRENDPAGLLEDILESVLNSDYFEDINNKKAYITTDIEYCANLNLLTYTKSNFEKKGTNNQFENRVAIWIHIGINPFENTKGTLYLAARSFDWNNLCLESKVASIKNELISSFGFDNYDHTSYPTKFHQSANVLLFETVTSY